MVPNTKGRTQIYNVEFGVLTGRRTFGNRVLRRIFEMWENKATR
jgi:hypothetical protein